VDDDDISDYDDVVCSDYVSNDDVVDGDDIQVIVGTLMACMAAVSRTIMLTTTTVLVDMKTTTIRSSLMFMAMNVGFLFF
jgi:hypothetical protein